MVLLMRAHGSLVRCSVECHVVVLLGLLLLLVLLLTAWSLAGLTVDS